MPRFVHQSHLPVSAEAVFRWHAAEGALQRLTPPWDSVELLGQEGPFEARRVQLRVGLGPIGARWLAQHRDVVPGRQFVDEQVEGPFKRWVHTHRFTPDGEGCVLEDEIDWEAPAVASPFFGSGFEDTLRRMFRYRHHRTSWDLLRHASWSRRPLRIAVTGARGLVGNQLLPFFTTGGHTVHRYVRGAARGADLSWDPEAGRLDTAALEGADAFVHLSGEPINTRWTEAKKLEFRRSRVGTTELVARSLAAMKNPPRRLVVASATGWYGSRGDEPLTEDAARGEGFLPELCEAWEAAAEPARKAGIEVAHVRIGVVLSGRGGALAELARPFALGVGGVVGSGAQWFSWITLDDLLAVILRLCVGGPTGPVNATTPGPVTNRELTTALGRVLGRPTVMPLPAFAVKTVFGEMGERLLLEGAKVLPGRLQADGFTFEHPSVEEAIRAELGR